MEGRSLCSQSEKVSFLSCDIGITISHIYFSYIAYYLRFFFRKYLNNNNIYRQSFHFGSMIEIKFKHTMPLSKSSLHKINLFSYYENVQIICCRHERDGGTSISL